MNRSDLTRLGVPPGEATRRGMDFVCAYLLTGQDKTTLMAAVEAIVRNPSDHLHDRLAAPFAKVLAAHPEAQHTHSAPWKQWGTDLDPGAVQQLATACTLPVAAAGALMPDAHLGYGLPIGGVLATRNAVLPYAVGVDIACRMKLSVLDYPLRDLDRRRERLIEAIERQTRFGIGAHFEDRRNHPVMDEDWSISDITRRNRDRAWAQLGTSGSGNHFVEFGTFHIREPLHPLPPGDYVALLSHSGSRGTGAAVCDHYSSLAMTLHPELPKTQRHLAWLDLHSAPGLEYWAAMELMGRYAAANHALIHHHIIHQLGCTTLLTVENHHNFAWHEQHLINGQSEDVVVHRKGATPATLGTLGIIPGSMASPGFLVRGRGNPDSLNSAAHGAGRLMSRRKALETFEWDKVHRMLRERRVHLLSAGLDEVPLVYKDIHAVMKAQTDLVDIIGRFEPRLVKMAGEGERAED